MKRFFVFLLVVLVTSAVAGEINQAERARIEQARKQLRELLCPASKNDPAKVVPREVFMRELQVILGDHELPSTDSLYGTKLRDIRRREREEGFTSEVRAAYEAFYWEWRQAIEP